MRHMVTTLFFGLAMAGPSAAVPVTWMGHLEDQAGAVSGAVSAIFTVTNDAGVVVHTLTEPSLLVDGGDFVVELDVPAAEGLTLAVVINGQALEPEAPLPLSWPRAAIAGRADLADEAEVTEVVGTVTVPVSTADLATAGRAVVPFTRVEGFPAAFLDGDQGIEFAPGATIDFTGGTVSVRAGSLPGSALGPAPAGADLAANTITTVDLADGTVGAVDLANLPVTKLADRTLTARNFGTSVVPVFQVTDARCSEGARTITTASSCRFTSTTTCLSGGLEGFVNCVGQCAQSSVSQCPNSPVGALVFP